jgi:hypothetical protein
MRILLFRGTTFIALSPDTIKGDPQEKRKKPQGLNPAA